MTRFLLLVILLSAFAANAQQIDKFIPDSVKAEYPRAAVVTMKENIVLEYFLGDDGKLKAKTTTNVGLFIADADDAGLNSISVPFPENASVEFIGGRLYAVEKSGSLMVKENLKLRGAQIRDFYVSNIFFGDFKVNRLPIKKEIEDNYYLDYTYVTIYNDLKYLTAEGPNPGTPYKHFKFEMQVPSFVTADVSLHGFHELFIIKDSTAGDLSIKSYSLKDYKGPRMHNLSVGSSYFTPHVLIHTRSYKRPNGAFTSVIGSIDDLYGWYAQLVAELKPNKAKLKSLSDQIVAGKSKPEDKINSIMRWVQDNITYVAFEDGIAGFKPDEAHRVIDMRYGDCKGMANVLVELLQAQGFDAYHCWVGTKHKPYSYSTPSLAVDNHMICALKFNGKYHFLDATGTEFKWNVIPYHLEGKEVLIGLDRNKHEIIKLPESKPGDNATEITIKLDFDESIFNNISGTIKLTGNKAIDARSMLKSTSAERIKFFSESYLAYIFDNSFIIEEASADFSKDFISITFKGRDAGLIFKNGSQNAVLLPKLSKLPVRTYNAEKDAPLEFDYPQVFKVNIEVLNAQLNPANKLALKSPLNGFSQELRVEHQGNLGKINYQLTLEKPLIMRDDMAEWNKFAIDFLNKYQFIKI